MCDKWNNAIFTLSKCNILNSNTRKVALWRSKIGDTYVMYLDEVKAKTFACLKVRHDEYWCKHEHQ